jgi:hypothetical protein
MSTCQLPKKSSDSDSQDPDHLSAAGNIFVFSPFGLSCCHVDCPCKPLIQLNHHSVQIHLKKHGLHCDSSFVKNLVKKYMSMVSDAKKSGQINDFRVDEKEYTVFVCDCGVHFTSMRSALRHCRTAGCNSVNLKPTKTIKLCCGRYVTDLQLDKFFNDKQEKQWDYTSARQILEAILREDEKSQHTYTHMYFPLIQSCGESENFLQKIRKDSQLIHDAPSTKEVYQMEHKISSDIGIFTRYIGCHISASGAAFFASSANFWYVFSTQLALGANTTLLRRFILIFHTILIRITFLGISDSTHSY